MSYWAKSDVMCSKSTVEAMEDLKDTRIIEDTRTISIDVVLVMSYSLLVYLNHGLAW